MSPQDKFEMAFFSGGIIGLLVVYFFAMIKIESDYRRKRKERVGKYGQH